MQFSKQNKKWHKKVGTEGSGLSIRLNRVFLERCKMFLPMWLDQPCPNNAQTSTMSLLWKWPVFTCIMSSVHSSMVVTHSVKVVQIVMGEDQLCRMLLFAWRLLPRMWPCSCVHVLHALTPLDDMGRHVQTGHGEKHRGGQLVPPLTNLFQRVILIFNSVHTGLYWLNTYIMEAAKVLHIT